MSGETIPGENIPGLMFDTLCDVFQQDPSEKYHSFVVTQSLRNLMHYVKPNQVIEVVASGQEINEEETHKIDSPPGKAASCVTNYERITSGGKLKYRKSKHGNFPWDEIKTWLDYETTVDDLAVRELVVMVRDEGLERHARDVMDEAFGLKDVNYLQSPFFFKMRSRDVDGHYERQLVKDHNDDAFLKSKGYRVLENEKVYSLRAQQKRGDNPMGVEPRELEDLAFNFSEQDNQSYGVLYSMLFINRWATAFSQSIAETSLSTWDEDGNWER